MARLDLGGLRDLWYRIDDIFCRLSEAIGSISFSGTTLSWRRANGAAAGSVNLDSVFATDAQAAHSFTWSGTTLTLNSVAGGALGSVNLNSGLASDSEAAHSLSLSNSSLVLESVSGATLATVSLSTLINNAVSSSTSGLMHTGTANDRFGSSLSLNGKRLSLISYDGTILSTVTLP